MPFFAIQCPTDKPLGAAIALAEERLHSMTLKWTTDIYYGIEDQSAAVIKRNIFSTMQGNLQAPEISMQLN